MSIEIHVPDIGNFSNVEVIEILVNVGDTVAIVAAAAPLGLEFNTWDGDIESVANRAAPAEAPDATPAEAPTKAAAEGDQPEPAQPAEES